GGRPEPYNNLAVIYNELGDARAAADALAHAADLAPDDPVIWRNLAIVYLKLAEEALARAAETGAGAEAQQWAEKVHELLGKLPPMRIAKARASAAAADRYAQPAVDGYAQSSLPPAADAYAQAKARPTKPAQPEDPYAEVRAAIERWRTAWEARDLEGYFAMYAPGFAPSGFADHEAWRRYKTRVILGKRRIRVRIEKLELFRRGDRIVARFVQHYRSDTYKDRTRKELEWSKGPHGWQIVAERVLD
ncbi:MAG: hypothetical protein D6771_03125, partial [Zetaproteobacteria bacterium]